jgi:hypothetical protein
MLFDALASRFDSFDGEVEDSEATRMVEKEGGR